MKSKTGKLEPIHIILGLMALAMAAILFFYNHVPIKAYYDQGNQELVITPGFLYTLEGYSFGYDPWHIKYPVREETLLPLSAQTDREYRFQGVPGTSNAGMDIMITYRDILTGKRSETWIHTNRWNSETRIVVSGDSGDRSFMIVIGSDET